MNNFEKHIVFKKVFLMKNHANGIILAQKKYINTREPTL